MTTRIACVSCGDFFEPELSDVEEFIAHGADARFLKRIPFPPEYREQIKTRKEYLVFLLMAYCPYCREVKFGKVACQNLPRTPLSEDKYLLAFRKEMYRKNEYQMVDTAEDFIALVDDEN